VIRYTTSTVFLPFLVTVRRTCATWAAPSNSIQEGASAALTLRRARRPRSVLTAETRDGGPGQLLELPVQAGMLALTVIT
jgi:hypothetical protein